MFEVRQGTLRRTQLSIGGLTQFRPRGGCALASREERASGVFAKAARNPLTDPASTQGVPKVCQTCPNFA